MPKNQGYNRHRNNYYRNDNYGGGHQNIPYQNRNNPYHYQNQNNPYHYQNENKPYHYQNQNNYHSQNYQGYDTGRNYNYRNQRPGPYDARNRHNNRQKNWNQHKNNGRAQQTAGEKENKPAQSANDQVLATLNKTAETVGRAQQTAGEKENKPAQSANDQVLATLSKTEETVGINESNMKKSTTPILNDNIQTQVATEQPLRPNFKLMSEEIEQAHKTLKYAEQQAQRQQNVCDANTVPISVDEKTVKEVKLFQTREELLENTKQSLLYKACKEQIEQNVQSTNYPKTPDTAIATSRWKEDYFKPWHHGLVRFAYYRILAGLDCDNGDCTGTE